MVAEDLVPSPSEPSSAIRWLRRSLFVAVLVLFGPICQFLIYVGLPIRVSYYEEGGLLVGIWISTRARSVPWMALVYLPAFVFGVVATSNVRGFIRIGSLPDPITNLNLFLASLALVREPLANAMLLVPLLYLDKVTVYERTHERQTTGRLSILGLMLFTGLVALALSWDSLVHSMFASNTADASFWTRSGVFLSSLILRCSIMMAVTVLIWGQCRSWPFAWASFALAIVINWAVWLILVLVTNRFSPPETLSHSRVFMSVLEKLGLVLVALVIARLMGVRFQRWTAKDT